MKATEFLACMTVICLISAPFIGLGLFVYKQTKGSYIKGVGGVVTCCSYAQLGN